MKRYISEVDEKYYTDMLKVLEAIGGLKLNYNWYITDIEVYPQDKNNNLIKQYDNNYLFLSNEELIELLSKNNFNWVWGCFSAIPVKYTIDDIQKYDMPYCNGNYTIHGDTPIIQHPLAEIEIDAEDSSSVSIVSKDDNIAELFKKRFPESEKNYWYYKNYYGTSRWNNYIKEKEEQYKTYKESIELFNEEINEGYIVEHNLYIDNENRYIGDKCRLILNDNCLFEWKNYYGKSQLHRVINHKNGNTYFIYNEDLYGYSVIDLNSKEHINYLPFESYRDISDSRYKDTFIFCDSHYNEYNNKIAIEGCFWAAPYSIITFDFSEPLTIKTIEYWKDVQNINSGNYNSLDFIKWNNDKLVVDIEGKIKEI